MKTVGIVNDKDVVIKMRGHAHRRPASRLAARMALLRTVRDLRQSVAAGRPMTLPNCLRLCRRRLAAGNSAVLASLESIYRKHQPFRRGPHVIRVRSE